MRRITVFIAAGLLAAACSSDPTGSQTNQLNFLVTAAGAPGIANPSDSFWAVSGQDRRLRIYYHSTEPGDSEILLDFKVPSGALFQRPDGTPFALGDSILIHVAVIDTVHLIVAFEPAGLLFSAATPAHLKLGFAETDDDVNHDGVVNQVDTTLTQQLQLWRQESSGAPWFPLSTVVTISDDEANTDIYSFTNYALAY